MVRISLCNNGTYVLTPGIRPYARCHFNATYDATAAIAEAEAACGARDDVDDVAKTSGALVVTASIGMIVNALVAIW